MPYLATLIHVKQETKAIKQNGRSVLRTCVCSTLRLIHAHLSPLICSGDVPKPPVGPETRDSTEPYTYFFLHIQAYNRLIYKLGTATDEQQ